MKVFAVLAVSVFTLFIVSCGNSNGSKTVTNAPAEMHGMDHSEHMHGTNMTNMMDHMQSSSVTNDSVVFCPVTGDVIHPGKEVRFTYNGYEFLLCCKDCIDDIKKDFEKYKSKGKKIN